MSWKTLPIELHSSGSDKAVYLETNAIKTGSSLLTFCHVSETNLKEALKSSARFTQGQVKSFKRPRVFYPFRKQLTAAAGLWDDEYLNCVMEGMPSY